MRLLSFFVLSLFLHASALLYPISFGDRSHAEMIQVTILPPEPEGGAGGPLGDESRATSGPAKPHRRARQAAMPKLEPQAFTDLAPPSLNAEDAAKVATASISTTPDPYPSPDSALSAGLLGGEPNRATTGLGGTANGAGVGTSGGGADQGSGSGVESSGFAVALTQASYRETPRPAYPETARRDGREGRVLLRVLVDDQGKPKRVEINNSSGSDSLDSAAVEAIKRWRFHPARYGEKPIESWLRIPIEFRLADAKF